MVKRIVTVLYLLISLYVLFGGIRDVDNATAWLQFVRGLFWVTVGGLGTYTAIGNIREWRKHE